MLVCPTGSVASLLCMLSSLFKVKNLTVVKVSKKHKVTEDPRRMPPIQDFTYESTREMEWDNIGKFALYN